MSTLVTPPQYELIARCAVCDTDLETGTASDIESGVIIITAEPCPVCLAEAEESNDFEVTEQ